MTAFQLLSFITFVLFVFVLLILRRNVARLLLSCLVLGIISWFTQDAVFRNRFRFTFS